ncbi:MAG: hypothetical protein HQ464_00020 [Planctomycetes bacterium]|nr:hypothetical protein [Planctomycetota bacterium]
MLLTCRGIWQGLVPEYSSYIFLGSPSPMTSGIYPPIYIAYGIARHLLADEHATFDVFASLHLLVGYYLTFLVARFGRYQPCIARLVGPQPQMALLVALFGAGATVACQRFQA